MLSDRLIERALGHWRGREVVPEVLRGMTLIEGRELSRVNPTLFYVPFEKQRPFHASKAKGRVLFGGNRSGKTEAGVLEVGWGLYGGHPWHLEREPSSGWVCYASHGKFEDTIWPKLRQWMPEGRWKYNATRRVLETDIGTTVSFKAWGDDPRGDKFESASIGWVSIDEEAPERVWDALQVRLLDQKGWWTCQLTPLAGMTYMKTRIEDRADGWRIWVGRIGMRDNPTLDGVEIEEMLGAIDDEGERLAREHGLFVPLGVRPVFDRSEMVRRRDMSPAPEAVGELEVEGGRVRFRSSVDGPLSVWEAPQRGGQYVVGADVAEGDERGDWSAAVVLRVDAGCEQVATYRAHEEEGAYSVALRKLATWYNRGWLGWEDNSCGRAVNAMITDPTSPAFYPMVYTRMVMDEEVRKPTAKVGWRTGTATRQVLIRSMRELLTDEVMPVKDARIYEEALTFCRNVRGRPGAASGCHDDLLMALGIADQVRFDASCQGGG